ncbi:MAG: DUF4838 domain-containing protein [Armatimonadetes bacterium]|nr:DUF4838 domain-containing protein [Armatimonadota bacterium]
MMTKSFVTVGLIVLLAAGSSVSAVGEVLQLAVDGQPRATILLAEKPTASAQLAAFELQHYLQKISGAKLPIAREPAQVGGNRILVGESDATRTLGYRNASFAEQEYTIRTFPKTLLLMGYDGQDFSEVRYDDYGSLYKATSVPLATCYAAHAFLEKVLGVRWYYPNEEIGEVVPTSATVTVKSLKIRRRPDAPVRHIYPLFANTKQLYFADWDQPQKFQSSWVDPRISLLYWIRNRLWGSMGYNANHSFHGYDVAFGESHPEWFSTKSYARMQQLSYQSEVQPCLTAPGFPEQVVQVAREYFDGKPPAYPDFYRATTGNFFPVVPNDNTNMCGCPTCRVQYRSDFGPTGNASHYVWGFVNRVAREVRQTHPKAMVSGLAYFNYTTPPKGLVFEPNVSVTFCKFYTEYWDKNSQERDYQRIAEYVNDNRARFFTTWEYLCHPFLTQWPLPCMVPHVQAQDVKRLSAIRGFMGGNMEYTYNLTYSGDNPGGYAWASPVLDFMNLYWRMKLYDDFSYDFAGGLEEYYRKFFGPGVEGMKKFFTALENRWMSLGGGEESRTWWGKLGTREFLDEVAGYMQQAKQATEEGTLYRKRVELMDAGIMQYLRQARARYEGSAMSEFAPIGAAAVARTSTGATADNWADDATWEFSLPNEITKTHFNDPAPEKTIFYLAHDDRNLYLKARCLESHVAQMKAATHDLDIGGFSDDSIELFFDPEGRGETYYQFCINSLGAVYDALENPTAVGATATITWNSGVQVKTSVGKDYWELRAAFPFAAWVTKTPQAGSTWRFNLCRNRYTELEGPPFSAWSPTLGGFRKPERFGVITFNAPADRGRTLWNCDFDSGSFASKAGTSPLIGLDGWYENTSYANQGWDKSWKVVDRGGNRLAVCNVNETNPSAPVPMHAVRVFPGVISVEVNYRRLKTDNQPTIVVTDAKGKQIGYMYAWSGRGDLIALEQPGNRQNFGNNEHGLGNLTDPGLWFGLKLDLDTVQKKVTGYVRREGGEWVPLNRTPLPYYDAEAGGNQLFMGFGSNKQTTVENNNLEMDNLRVTQVSREVKAEH